MVDFDRRGRGDSGDTEPYAVAREVEDIEALIDAHGGRAALFGFSSGAVLALEAADALNGKVSEVALYEPPFILDDSRPPLPADYVERLGASLEAGDRGQAVELFMTEAVGIPAEYVEGMKNQPAAPVVEGRARSSRRPGRTWRSLPTPSPTTDSSWATRCPASPSPPTAGPA